MPTQVACTHLCSWKELWGSCGLLLPTLTAPPHSIPPTHRMAKLQGCVHKVNPQDTQHLVKTSFRQEVLVKS